jgi:hypothetical protein
MYGSIGLASLLLYYKPDTRWVSFYWFVYISPMQEHSIQGWALKEAKARMEARGEKVQYKP